MAYSWIYYVLISQLAWAFCIYIDKYLLDSQVNTDKDADAPGILVLVSALFNFVVALVVFIFAALQGGLHETLQVLQIGTSGLLLALLVGFLEVLWLIPYFYALDYSDEVTAPPILQTIPIFGFMLGFFVFSEVPSFTHVIAGIVILFGALILNIELIHEEQEDTHDIKIHWKGIVLMLIASFVIAISGFLFKDSAMRENFLATTFWTAVGGGLTGILIWIGIPSYRKHFNGFITRKNWKVFGLNFFNEIVDNVAIYVYYAAIVFGPSTALVQSTIAYQPVLLLIIAYILNKLGSDAHKRGLSGNRVFFRLLGIALVFFGSVFIF